MYKGFVFLFVYGTLKNVDWLQPSATLQYTVPPKYEIIKRLTSRCSSPQRHQADNIWITAACKSSLSIFHSLPDISPTKRFGLAASSCWLDSYKEIVLINGDLQFFGAKRRLPKLLGFDGMTEYLFMQNLSEPASHFNNSKLACYSQNVANGILVRTPEKLFLRTRNKDPI